MNEIAMIHVFMDVVGSCEWEISVDVINRNGKIALEPHGSGSKLISDNNSVITSYDELHNTRSYLNNSREKTRKLQKLKNISGRTQKP